MRALGVASLVLFVLFAPLLSPGGVSHADATLEPVNGSGIAGRAELTELPDGETLISLTATGLRPGVSYVSFYADNSNCKLDEASADDVIAEYKANADGVATVTAKVEDDVQDIQSVSVTSNDLDLEACGPVKP